MLLLQRSLIQYTITYLLFRGFDTRGFII